MLLTYLLAAAAAPASSLPKALDGAKEVTFRIGPTSLDWPAWVQAICSVAAIVVALGLGYRQNRRLENERIGRDAAFAAFIESFLTSIGSRIDAICRRGEHAPEHRSLEAVCADSLASLDADVLRRLTKLRDMPLTDWPDIEFASTFTDICLAAERQFELLGEARVARASAPTPTIDVDAEDMRFRAALRDADLDADDERDGDEDDGRSYSLGTRSERHARALASLGWTEREEEKDAFAAHNRMMAEQDLEMLREQRRDELRELFRPFRDLAASWGAPDAPIAVILRSYLDAARKRKLEPSFNGRRRPTFTLPPEPEERYGFGGGDRFDAGGRFRRATARQSL